MSYPRTALRIVFMTFVRTKPRKTVDDYFQLPDDVRAELIEGEFFVTPSPTSRHQRIVGNLFVLLRDVVSTHSLGELFVSPLDVVLPSGDVVQPDLLFVATANLSIVQDRIRGVPDHVVEVVSQTAPERDRIVKRDLYARNGVKEYWVVDEERRNVEVYVLNETSYGAPGLFEASDVIESTVLAEISFPVAAIFA